MDIYSNYGQRFYIALGYEEKIKDISSKLEYECIDTGSDTMTGGRLKDFKNIYQMKLLLTYGDGISNKY